MGKCKQNNGDLRITKTFSTAILMIPSASGETDSLKSTKKKTQGKEIKYKRETLFYDSFSLSIYILYQRKWKMIIELNFHGYFYTGILWKLFLRLTSDESG